MRLLDLRETATPRLRDERGFTLIEALGAAILLAVGLLAVVGVFNDSRDQSATGERHQIALMQAEQALEEMRGLPYKNLLLTAGAVDPTPGERVLDGGASFRVKPELTERVVYPATEGVPATNAWVRPLSSVEIGPAAAPLELTIHRFVTWRDEECRVADLSALGLNLPSALTATKVPLLNLINNVLGSVVGLLSGTDKQRVQALKARLEGLRDAVNAREAAIGDAIAGVSEADLCDIDLALLSEIQKLSRLTPGLINSGKLRDRLVTLENSFGGLCLLGICLLKSEQNAAIDAVNGQLDCLFGSGSGNSQFNAYLDGVLQGIQSLPEGLAHTDRNTKRIAVAVVVKPRGGVGPFEPVWASSVVRDPKAGLLSSGATTC